MVRNRSPICTPTDGNRIAGGSIRLPRLPNISDTVAPLCLHSTQQRQLPRNNSTAGFVILACQSEGLAAIGAHYCGEIAMRSREPTSQESVTVSIRQRHDLYFADLRLLLPIFAHFCRIFSHSFSHGIWALGKLARRRMRIPGAKIAAPIRQFNSFTRNS